MHITSSSMQFPASIKPVLNTASSSVSNPCITYSARAALLLNPLRCCFHGRAQLRWPLNSSIAHTDPRTSTDLSSNLCSVSSSKTYNKIRRLQGALVRGPRSLPPPPNCVSSVNSYRYSITSQLPRERRNTLRRKGEGEVSAGRSRAAHGAAVWKANCKRGIAVLLGQALPDEATCLFYIFLLFLLCREKLFPGITGKQRSCVEQALHEKKRIYLTLKSIFNKDLL